MLKLFSLFYVICNLCVEIAFYKVIVCQMGMTEEMMNDTLDDLLTESGDEEEQDAIVNQVHFMMLAPLEPTSHQQYLM